MRFLNCSLYKSRVVILVDCESFFDVQFKSFFQVSVRCYVFLPVFSGFVLLLFFVCLLLLFFCQVFGLCEQAKLFGSIVRLSWSRRKKSWARSGGSGYKLQLKYPKQACLPKAMRRFKLYSVNPLNQSQLELNARSSGKRT